MDTPVKSQQPPLHQIGTPFSRIEDSPVFNYINSLSPIKPVKSVHIMQTFHSMSFASIPSVFTSPHVSTQKESRLLIRYPLSDLSKPEFSSDNGDENNACTGVSNVIKLSYCAVDAQESCNISCSLNEATVEPPDECQTLPVKLSHSLQYDCGSPNHNTIPCYGAKADLKLTIGSTSMVQLVHYGLEERINSDADEIESQGIHHSDQTKDEGTGCDWENLITDDAEDLLIFDSCTESEACKERDNKFGKDNIDDSQKAQSDGSVSACLQNATQGPSQNHSGEVGEQNEIDHTPQVLSTCQKKSGLSVPNDEVNDEIRDCVPLDCKVGYQNQRGMRRRCLFSEVAGSHKKSLHSDLKNNSSASLPHGKLTSDDRQPASFKPGAGPSPRVLSSIGLHLNALATTSKARMVTQDSLSSGRHLISMPCSSSPFPSLTSGQRSSSSCVAVEELPCSIGSEDQDLQVVQDSLQAPAIGNGEELTHNSPKKKKRKLESGGESEACKRCNCKKSKCLKLYCECFAAGVYCVEPCACQGCFNKPIHEDTVLATRKQIESRNPLAFAPKVIRTSESSADIGEEANKTPASARHKRGCNCKKSSCLKKYCECYQGGVGCSISCRCEGCKNAFGRKYGGMLIGNEETEHEEEDDCEKDEDKPDGTQQNADVQKDEKQLSENVLPMTPSFQICGPSVKLPFFSTGKPPRSSVLSIGSSSWLNACHTLGKSEHLLSQPKFEKNSQIALEDETPDILRGDSSPITGVKTASPNRKRVSPPHLVGLSPNRKGGRKLILKSIPSFPPLTNDASNEFSTSYPQSSFNSTRLG